MTDNQIFYRYIAPPWGCLKMQSVTYFEEMG